VESPTAPSLSPRRKPARSISQAADSLTRPSRSGQRGIAGSPARASTRAASAALTTGFTKNEPRLRRFSFEHHRLGPPDRQDGVPHLGERRRGEPAGLEGARQLGVADGRGAAGDQPVRHREDQVAIRFPALEGAAPVREAARLGIQCHDTAARSVQGADDHDRLADVLAVGADVLDRRRADQPRPATTILQRHWIGPPNHLNSLTTTGAVGAPARGAAGAVLLP
jgi:hypothetical protein